MKKKGAINNTKDTLKEIKEDIKEATIEIKADIKETKEDIKDVLTPKKKGPIREAYLWVKHNRPLFYGLIALVALIVIFFGTKTYLYTNFILGNDIVLKFNADKENLNLIRDEQGNVSFEASITTNPFCKADCKTEFEDVLKADPKNKTAQQVLAEINKIRSVQPAQQQMKY